MTAMSQFSGEANIRLRFTEYMKRFTSLASYQEYSHTGRSKIGYPPVTFKQGRLGSGTVFADDAHKQREMRTNGHKIDAWRRTDSYKLHAKVRPSPSGSHHEDEVFCFVLTMVVGLAKGT